MKTPTNTEAPEFPGIYRIYLDGKCAYVGQAINIKERLKAHNISAARREGLFKGVGFRDMEIVFRQVDDAKDRTRLERWYISFYKPACNLSGIEGKCGRLQPQPKHKLNAKFREFVNTQGGQSVARRLLGLSESHISLLYNGKRKVTPKLAELVEEKSGGKITRESLIFTKRKAKPNMPPSW